MYADPKKYLLNEPEHIWHVKESINYKGIGGEGYKDLIENCLIDKDGAPVPGRWYWIGIDNFLGLCKKYNYNISSEDLNIDKTNPITLFSK
jgi:hypothetical protein